jgi:hypothetical protein
MNTTRVEHKWKSRPFICRREEEFRFKPGQGPEEERRAPDAEERRPLP